jgi:hypothetical protein
VAPRSVVEALDVGKDIAPGFCACCVLPVMDTLGFEGVEEAFHRGIVVESALRLIEAVIPAAVSAAR